MLYVGVYLNIPKIFLPKSRFGGLFFIREFIDGGLNRIYKRKVKKRDIKQSKVIYIYLSLFNLPFINSDSKTTNIFFPAPHSWLIVPVFRPPTVFALLEKSRKEKEADCATVLAEPEADWVLNFYCDSFF